jgi:Na+/melibiose symporter-like transporter
VGAAAPTVRRKSRWGRMTFWILAAFFVACFLSFRLGQQAMVMKIATRFHSMMDFFLSYKEEMGCPETSEERHACTKCASNKNAGWKQNPMNQGS